MTLWMRQRHYNETYGTRTEDIVRKHRPRFRPRPCLCHLQSTSRYISWHPYMRAIVLAM